jgi:hypothetical protein
MNASSISRAGIEPRLRIDDASRVRTSCSHIRSSSPFHLACTYPKHPHEGALFAAYPPGLQYRQRLGVVMTERKILHVVRGGGAHAYCESGERHNPQRPNTIARTIRGAVVQ